MLIQAQYLRASAVAALPVFVLMVFLVDQMGFFPGVFGSGGMLAFVVMLLAGGVYFGYRSPSTWQPDSWVSLASCQKLRSQYFL